MFPPSSEKKGYVSWIVTIFQLFEADPERFPDARTDGIQRVLGDRSAEDWNRGYEILRCYWRVKSSSRKTEGTRQQDRVAVVPPFLTESSCYLL